MQMMSLFHIWYRQLVLKNISPTPPSVSCNLLIAYLIDPDSHAGWSFILLVGPPKPDRLKIRGQTKSQQCLIFIFTFLLFFLPFTFLLFCSFISPNTVLFSSVYKT